MMLFPQGDFISQLNENLRRIVISGTICEGIAAQFLDQLTAFEFANISSPVSLYLSTYGGDVSAALEIYDAIKIASVPVVCICTGKCMSAGTLICSCCEKGSRYTTENCRFMTHEIQSGAFGTMSQLENNMDEIRKLQDIYVDLLAKETGQSTKKILQDIKTGDYFMSAQEAIKYGLVDKIVPERKKPPIIKTIAKNTHKKASK